LKFKRILIGIAILVAVIGGGFFLITNTFEKANGGSGALFAALGSENYVMATSYPVVPDYLPIYQTKESDISPESAARISQSIGDSRVLKQTRVPVP
jgi:hypothetical protein